MIETAEKNFSFAEFELDTAKRRLLKAGQPVMLNPKAFNLLAVLVSEHGRILSKDELLETVWANQFVEENNLTVHISALRKIFGEKKGEHRFIATILGKGYKFVAEVNAAPIENFHANQNNSNADGSEQIALQIAASDQFGAGETLIGRTREISEIRNLIGCGATNLITLTGAGGAGKTSLARAVGNDLQADFADGVFFVELAAVRDAELVAPTVMQTLGATESDNQNFAAVLKNFLRDRRVLLILDNFEQITRAAPLVKELLAASANLKILITSRIALRLEDETEFVVAPLAVPPKDAHLSFEKISDFSAVRLFLKRAKIVKPHFNLNGENAAAVAGICRRLDGLPLAIELAAARVKLLSPQSIFTRLEHSLNLLTRSASASQRTMRETIQWSYELLEPDEQNLFRRLAVFVGGFTIEAAENVNANEWTITNQTILDLLTSLAENNLLAIKEQTDGGVRLRMLEVVREFALECLETSGEAEAVRRSHSEFFLALAEEAEPFLEGETENEWLEKLESEHDNIRAALGWSLKNDAAAAARIAAAVRAFWIDHSHHGEGLRWCEAAVQATENSFSEARLKLLATSGNFLRVRGEFEAARKFHEKGLTESQKLNNPLQISRNNFGLGVIAVLQKDYAAAQNFFQKSLAISREINEEMGIAYLLNALADLEMCQGNFSTARPLLEECLTLSKKLDSERLLLTVYFNLGMVEFVEHFYEKAAFIFAETLRIAREMGNKTYVAYALDGFAALAAEAGNREQSARLSGAAASLLEEIGYKIEPAEEIFREKYLAQICRALDEKQFAALYAQGRAMNSDEAVALARLHPAKSGANRNQFNQAFHETGEQSEIIIENHSFSRIIIEEETGDEPICTSIETNVLKS